LVVAFMFWNAIEKKDANNTKNITTKAVTFAPEIINTITINGNKIIIQGITNLPDGTNVKYNLWHLDKLSAKNNIEKVVAVQNKTLSCEIVLDGKINPQEMTLNSEVFFNNNNQSEQVKQILGEKGQNLNGSNVKYTGDYKGLLFQDKLVYPDEQSYAANKTAIEKQQQKEEAVKKDKELAERKSKGVSIGMTQEEVLQSMWGKPQKVNKTINGYGTSEQWVYDGGYLYFDNGKLTTIQN
jgi:hypothetical protein